MADAFRKTPTPIVFLIFCFLCPTEFSLFLGDIRLPPHRIALLLLVPFAVVQFLTRPDIRIRTFDWLFIAFGGWLVMAYTYHGHGASGFVYGGSLGLETSVSYLIARAWVRDVKTLQATLKVALVAISVAALIALPETLFGQIFTHDLLAKLTGYVHPTGVRTRLGFTRAFGTFDHPIHYGTFCAALLAMFWYSERQISSRIKRTTLVTGATFLGLSSAPILCLLVQGSLIFWERITRGIASRMWLTFAALACAYVAIDLLSNRSPAAIFATTFTLDSWTGYYRLLIWEYGLNNVAAHPMLGIGLADWDRPAWMTPETIDAFWLLLAMRSGVPSVLLLATAILLLTIAVNKRGVKSNSALARGLSRGWLFSLIALCFIAATVHFWNVSQTFFFFFIGLGGALADPKPQRKSQKAVQRQPTVVRPTPQSHYGVAIASALTHPSGGTDSTTNRRPFPA